MSSIKMSRPILSRPRTRVYGCNYDKGESYYKPMVDNLDRKYSGRPLFSEPRTSLADEIAARRNDIGSRDLSGPRNNSFGRDLDLELDPRPRASQTSPLTDPLLPEDEDTVYDSRGQRTRRRVADDFANEVSATTQRFKQRLAAIGIDEDIDVGLPKSRRARADQDLLESSSLSMKKTMQNARSLIEDAESSFKRRTKLFDEAGTEEAKPSMTRWSKLINDDEDLVPVSAAATRAKQTKARLNDLESEMEELAERQAKRERRAAALRALVNENAVASEDVQQQSVLSSRNLSGNRNDSYDDLDFIYDRGSQDEFEDDFVTAQRRYKQRAAAAFEEDLAELRRKRRDMQDRLFDVIDLNAEIEKARTTLEAADLAFQRHATKFDNEDREDMSLTEKLDRSRKIAGMELVPEKPAQQKSMALKWAKIPPVDIDSCVPQPTKQRQNRINSLVDAAEITDPLEMPALRPLKSRFLKRKKSVSF